MVAVQRRATSAVRIALVTVSGHDSGFGLDVPDHGVRQSTGRCSSPAIVAHGSVLGCAVNSGTRTAMIMTTTTTVFTIARRRALASSAVGARWKSRRLKSFVIPPQRVGHQEPKGTWSRPFQTGWNPPQELTGYPALV
jgi:hypothetical protein